MSHNCLWDQWEKGIHPSRSLTSSSVSWESFTSTSVVLMNKDRVNLSKTLTKLRVVEQKINTHTKALFIQIDFIDILGSLPLWMRKESLIEWKKSKATKRNERRNKKKKFQKCWKGTWEDLLNRSVACIYV